MKKLNRLDLEQLNQLFDTLTERIIKLQFQVKLLQLELNQSKKTFYKK